MSNTIDLRGNEQVSTRAQAEQYAAYLGCEMMYFGYSDEPQDVDPEAAMDYDEDNPWYGNTHSYCDVCSSHYPNDAPCEHHQRVSDE